jgi:peptidoglycan/xylan/chitin deacetylase (PgdA/CDA1 family)
MSKKLVWKIPTDEKIVYLTFDDGPIPKVTEFVLNELAKWNAKATFFCVGDNIRKNHSVFTQIIAEKHSIGNHTFNHLKGWTTPNKTFFDNIILCQSYIERDFPNGTTLFRPPHGAITIPQINVLIEKFKIIMWDVLTVDYDPDLNVNIALPIIIDAIKPGSIIVFHDSLKAEKNIRFLLPSVLEYLSINGFRCEVLEM